MITPFDFRSTKLAKRNYCKLATTIWMRLNGSWIVPHIQMDYICQQYDGFYRFAKLMERMAQGIADGIIEVPKDH